MYTNQSINQSSYLYYGPVIHCQELHSEAPAGVTRSARLTVFGEQMSFSMTSESSDICVQFTTKDGRWFQIVGVAMEKDRPAVAVTADVIVAGLDDRVMIVKNEMAVDGDTK